MAALLHVDVAWRSGAPADETVRRRVVEELRGISWTLSQMQVLVADAHDATAFQHAYLVPRMELRLPLYDLDLRYRVVIQQLDKPLVTLVDGEGKRIADVRLL